MAVIPETMLAPLDAPTRAAVTQRSPIAAAVALLDVAEGVPPFSSKVGERSRWLAYAGAQLAVAEAVPANLELRLLAEIARTAFAAHETTAAMTATEQALLQAEEIGDLALCSLLRARRLPWLVFDAIEDATAEYEALHAMLQHLPEEQRSPALRADLCMGEAAYFAGLERWDDVRVALAGLGRAGLAVDERLHWYAFTSQVALSQLGMRTGKRVPAVRSLMEAARLAHELEAWAELADVQTVVAAFAVRTGSFETGISHARSALSAMENATLSHAQVDPWLGVPLDIASEVDFAGAIRSLAESVVRSLDRGDRQAFLLSACALVAFYLVADRAPEALDALKEAIEAAQEMDDAAAESLLRSISESLLRFMGVLS